MNPLRPSSHAFLPHSYLGSAAGYPNILSEVVDACAERLRRLRGEGLGLLGFDSLLCTGASGLIVTPALAVELGVPWAFVTKGSGHTRDGMLFGVVGPRVVIVDDFVSTGQTLYGLVHAVRTAPLICGQRPEVVALLQWKGKRDERSWGWTDTGGEQRNVRLLAAFPTVLDRLALATGWEREAPSVDAPAEVPF